MDTDSIVSALVSGYKVKKDSYVKKQTTAEWKIDAWKEMNNKISSFYSKSVSTLRFTKAYNLKKSTANSTKATVTAGNNAVTGTQTLKIKQLATSGYLTGGVVSKADGKTGKIAGDTNLSELGVEAGSKITVGSGSKSKTITVNSSMTVDKFVAAMKDAGVTASFDASNQRFFVSANGSGKDADFSITAENESGSKALGALGLAVTTEADMKKYQSVAAWTADDLNAAIESEYTKKMTAKYDISDEATVKKLKDGLQSEIDVSQKQIDNIQKENENIEHKLNAAASFEDEYGSKTEDEKKTIMVAMDSQIKALADNQNRTDEEEAEYAMLQAKKTVYTELSKDGADADAYVTELETKQSDNEDKLNQLNDIIVKNQNILSNDGEFETYVNELNNDIDAANSALKDEITDSYQKKFDQATAYANAYTLVNTEGVDKSTQAYKDAEALLGMNQGKMGATRIVGQDSEIELNGATFTAASNSYSINGLNINANALTEDGEEITITTNTDTKGIYDTIKNFFKDYNELIKEMDSKYNAPSAKGYEPLTDEEKDALTDTEIDKWETKIKDALLRKDENLNSLATMMKTMLQKTYEVNGEKLSLSSFGIKTSGYFASGENEKGMFHIDGDADDEKTASATDKLMEAISADPDKVSLFFTKLTEGLYEEMTKRTKTSSLKSYGTFYNDKAMKKDYDSYKDVIKKWEEKIENYETRYRKQFTAMEKALSNLNSQQSQLSGLLGM